MSVWFEQMLTHLRRIKVGDRKAEFFDYYIDFVKLI